MNILFLKEFKAQIRRLLLNILVNENDYIETPIIVQKIGLANELQLVNFSTFSLFFYELLVISLPPLHSFCFVFDCNNCNSINFILKQL